MQNIYEGLQVEPMNPVVIERIHLRGKILSDNQFVFVPEYWMEALKPYSKAKWGYEKASEGRPTCQYRVKSGAFLVFTEFKAPQHGGFYAAHLYMIVKELPDSPIYCTFTEDGLIMERKEEGKVVQRIELKPRAMQLGDTPYHAILSY